MESETDHMHIEESEGMKRKGEEERLFQLQHLKALFFLLAQDEEEKGEVDECFSSLKKGDEDAFYQKGCRLVRSFLENKKLSKSDCREFLICFFIKGISSKVSEETNIAILSFMETLLENDELKRKYSQEIVKRAMRTGYPLFEYGQKFFYLKKFCQEIEYSEEREIPQINNEVPVCLICKRINDYSLLSEWMNESNVVFVKNEYSSSSPNEAELISSFALRNKLFNRLQDNKNRNHSLTENNPKEERLMIGMNEQQINDFFTKYNEVTSLKVLYDSDVDERTTEKCHEKIDKKGATITFVQKGNKFIGGIAYQNWNNEREIVFDALANIFSISEEMRTFPVQKKATALFNNGSVGPKFGINDLTVLFYTLRVSFGWNLSSYSLPETFKNEFGMEGESSECDVDRVVVFSFEYDTRKFLQRIIGNEEETNTFINLFKDVEEAKEFLECFENKEQAEEYLAKCSDEKEMSEYRMNFNENRRRKFGGECGEDCFWIFKDGTLFIEGKGKMKDYGWNDAPWFSKREQIENVVISKGITAIGDCAFYECSSLTSITIPNSITIGKYAFYKCSSLTSITIPNSVTAIEDRAFWNCSSLTTATLPKKFKSQKDNIFEGCEKLKTINWK